MHRVLRSLLSEATRRAVAVEELRVQVALLSSWLQFLVIVIIVTLRL